MSEIQRHNPTEVASLPQLLSQVVTTGGRELAYLSGQVAWNADGEPTGVGDHLAQARQIAARIDAILESLGSSRRDIVKETIYVVDYAPTLVAELLNTLHGDVPPASTLVEVKALYHPDYLIEVDLVVALEPH